MSTLHQHALSTLGCIKLQNRRVRFPPPTLESDHGYVSSLDAAMDLGGVLEAPPARIESAMGVLLPIWCAPMRAAVSNGVRRFPPRAGVFGMRSDWDKGYRSTRYDLGWPKGGVSARSSSSKSWSRTTPSISPTSAPVGVQPSGLCGPHAPRLSAPIGSLGGCSCSSASSASLALSSCSLQGPVTSDSSLLASWLMAAQSNRLLQDWKSLWSRRPASTRRAVA